MVLRQIRPVAVMHTAPKELAQIAFPCQEVKSEKEENYNML